MRTRQRANYLVVVGTSVVIGTLFAASPPALLLTVPYELSVDEPTSARVLLERRTVCAPPGNEVQEASVEEIRNDGPLYITVEIDRAPLSESKRACFVVSFHAQAGPTCNMPRCNHARGTVAIRMK